MLISFNKPWGVLCQFSDPSGGSAPRSTLADFIDIPAVYPAGRLDQDSEGLVLLTDDGKLQAKIANPAFGSRKCYLVQVEGVPSASQLDRLGRGVVLKDGPARARRSGASTFCRTSGEKARLVVVEEATHPSEKKQSGFLAQDWFDGRTKSSAEANDGSRWASNTTIGTNFDW
jgi:pseudouridine synthase